MSYIIDTNIITAIIKEDERVKRKLQKIAFYGGEIFINAVSYYEIKRGLLASNATTKLGIFDELCKKFEVLLLGSQEIFDKASEIYAELRRKGKLIEDADILIAAMALTQSFILVSDDTHFSRIGGITLENWLRE